MEGLEQLLHPCISKEKAKALIVNVSEEEIKSTMFSLQNDKAPGLDGYTPLLFKRVWNIVGKDVTKAIESFFKLKNVLK